MLHPHHILNDRQISGFQDFLVDGTGHALTALEDVFGLTIESSDSALEISALNESKYIQNLGNDKIYTVISNMDGDLQGHIMLLIRSGDFELLGEAMRPILSLLFLSNPDSDLEQLEQQKPEWMSSSNAPAAQDDSFRAQMLDLLGEIGNVLIGLYAKALYRNCHITARHSAPEAQEDPEQALFRRTLSPTEEERIHLVIENGFTIMDESIKLWCVICPTDESFRALLRGTGPMGAIHHRQAGL